jgi:acyl-CoA reductase-like NAD-dependent aldehyde dehydrogenase
MKLMNPATGETIREIKDDSTASITEKFKAAKQAQGFWSLKRLEERVSVIQKFHDLLKSNIETLAKDLSLEVGKPVQEARNEINGACYRIKFFLENSSKWLNEQKLNHEGITEEFLAHDALGVIANISAWNYPFLVGVNVFVPALISGNAVLYKPSEYATVTGLNIEKYLHEAGVPKAVFVSVIGAREAGEALLNLELDGYFFTGSYRTGKYIAEKVAHRLVPVGLELGGKDPLYVTDEIVDIKKVAAGVVEGCFYNNGQSCCAVERVYVHERQYDAFLAAFIEETKKLSSGNPLDEKFTQGAITRPVHVEFLEEQVKDAVGKGAQVLAGGKRSSGKGAFFEPTVLANVNHTMRVMKEETFGPVIGIQKVKTDEEAVALMQDCEYGLTASVYSTNIPRAKVILNQVDAGTSYVNCCDRVSPYLPWSGRKNSGLGSTLSFMGILAFTKPRSWHVRTP